MPVIPWTKIHDFLIRVCSAREVEEFNTLVCAHIVDLVPHDFPILCVSSTREDLKSLAQGEQPAKLIDPTIRALAGDPDTVAEWNQYFRFRLPITDGYFASSLVSDFKPYSNTEFVTDFVRPRSVDLCLGGWFRRYTVVIPRCRPARQYSETEIAISRIISPHLENHYCVLSLASSLQQDARFQAVKRSAARVGLTQREQEVAFLLAVGLSIPEIARKLFISRRTVEAHVEHIYGKVGVRNRRDALDYLLGASAILP